MNSINCGTTLSLVTFETDDIDDDFFYSDQFKSMKTNNNCNEFGNFIEVGKGGSYKQYYCKEHFFKEFVVRRSDYQDIIWIYHANEVIINENRTIIIGKKNQLRLSYISNFNNTEKFLNIYINNKKVFY